MTAPDATTAARAGAMTVSLIATVLNERETIREWLELLKTQTRKPDELVVCDGGSTDGTLDVLAAFARENPKPPLKIISRPGANIAAGRNAAIEAASGGVIAVGDAGSIPRPDWLERLVAPFAAGSTALAVAGSYRFLDDTRFRRAAAAYLGRPWTLPGFQPSSRSIAFTKDAWKQAGGYPEWLTLAAEDSLFNAQLHAAGVRFTPALDAIVLWNVRPSLGSFLKMIARNAFGDAEARLGMAAALKTAAKLALYLAVLGAIACIGTFKIGAAATVAFVVMLLLSALASRAALSGAPLGSWPEFFALNVLGGPAYLYGFARGVLFGRRAPRG